jgi:hypothetical protein
MIDEKAFDAIMESLDDYCPPENRLRKALEAYESAKEPVSLEACLDALQGVADLNEHGTGMNYETMTKAVLTAAGVKYKEGV